EVGRVARERADDADRQEQGEDREHRPDGEGDPARGRRGGSERQAGGSPGADGEVGNGSSRLEPRSERGASYTWDSGRKGCLGEACHPTGDAAHERPAERCYDDVTTTGVAFQA